MEIRYSAPFSRRRENGWLRLAKKEQRDRGPYRAEAPSRSFAWQLIYLRPRTDGDCLSLSTAKNPPQEFSWSGFFMLPTVLPFYATWFFSNPILQARQTFRRSASSPSSRGPSPASQSFLFNLLLNSFPSCPWCARLWQFGQSATTQAGSSGPPSDNLLTLWTSK